MAKRSMVLVSFLAAMLSVAAPAMTQEGPRFTAPPADERLSRTRLRADLLDRPLLMRPKALPKNTRVVISLLHELFNTRA